MTTTIAPPVTVRAFTLTASGPFSLAAVSGFLGGMLPIADQAPDDTGAVRLAFVPDGEPIAAVGVSLRPTPGGVAGTLVAEHPLSPDQAERAIAQTARALSLDVDGSGFAELGRRDPVLGILQARFPGLRPVNYLSPYEAAAWLIMGHRIRMTQAAAIKQRLTQESGARVTIDGHEHRAFPGPAVLADLGPTRGLNDVKVERLRALGRAAIDTDLLDGEAIRRQGAEQSIAALQALPGVGPFTAEGIVLRGAGEPDYLTLLEPRLPRAVQQAYDLPSVPTSDELVARSDAWRPYRQWVTFLLRVFLGDR